MRAFFFAALGTVSMVSVLLAAPMSGNSVAPASADPGGDVVEVIATEPAPEPPRLIGWPQLGLPDRIDLLGANQPSETAVPVPAGTVPTVLSGIVGAVVNVVSGRVDVLDDRGMVLGTIRCRPMRRPYPSKSTSAQPSSPTA